MLIVSMTDDYQGLRDALARALDDLDDLIRIGLRRLGLDARESRLLHALEAGGAQSQRGLGELLRIDRTTMVALIDRLEHVGFLRRSEHPDDRRAYAVELTRKGAEACDGARGAVADAERALLERLAGHDRPRARRLLRELGGGGSRV